MYENRNAGRNCEFVKNVGGDLHSASLYYKINFKFCFVRFILFFNSYTLVFRLSMGTSGYFLDFRFPVPTTRVGFFQPCPATRVPEPTP